MSYKCLKLVFDHVESAGIIACGSVTVLVSSLCAEEKFASWFRGSSIGV